MVAPMARRSLPILPAGRLARLAVTASEESPVVIPPLPASPHASAAEHSDLREVAELRLLTLTEVAHVMRLGFAQVKELVRRGEIAALRAGEDYRVPPAAIRAFYQALIDGRAPRVETRPRSVGRRPRPGAS